MEIFGKFLILDNKWQRKSQPQSQPSPDAPPKTFRKRLPFFETIIAFCLILFQHEV